MKKEKDLELRDLKPGDKFFKVSGNRLKKIYTVEGVPGRKMTLTIGPKGGKTKFCNTTKVRLWNDEKNNILKP